MKEFDVNMLGTRLQSCCMDPLTGYYRDGSCRSNPDDYGNHSICAVMSEEFLEYTKLRGNDLSTSNPRFGFPGLKPGDKWCLCAIRWVEGKVSGISIPINFEASSERAYETLNNINLAGRNRVIRCSPKLYQKQQQEIDSHLIDALALKLVVIPDRRVDGCLLIDLDGEVKRSASDIFSINSLKGKKG